MALYSGHWATASGLPEFAPADISAQADYEGSDGQCQALPEVNFTSAEDVLGKAPGHFYNPLAGCGGQASFFSGFQKMFPENR
jgi:hypothetical protein